MKRGRRHGAVNALLNRWTAKREEWSNVTQNLSLNTSSGRAAYDNVLTNEPLSVITTSYGATIDSSSSGATIPGKGEMCCCSLQYFFSVLSRITITQHSNPCPAAVTYPQRRQSLEATSSEEEGILLSPRQPSFHYCSVPGLTPPI